MRKLVTNWPTFVTLCRRGEWISQWSKRVVPGVKNSGTTIQILLLHHIWWWCPWPSVCLLLGQFLPLPFWALHNSFLDVTRLLRNNHIFQDSGVWKTPPIAKFWLLGKSVKGECRLCADRWKPLRTYDGAGDPWCPIHMASPAFISWNIFHL